MKGTKFLIEWLLTKRINEIYKEMGNQSEFLIDQYIFFVILRIL